MVFDCAHPRPTSRITLKELIRPRFLLLLNLLLFFTATELLRFSIGSCLDELPSARTKVERRVHR